KFSIRTNPLTAHCIYPASCQQWHHFFWDAATAGGGQRDSTIYKLIHMKRSSPIYTIIFFFLALMLGIAYFRQQQRVRKILNQNERLLNENRDLQRSLKAVSGTAQQIAGRKEQQQRLQGKFVERRAYYRRNWQQFIAVSTNDYRTGFLGGIRNLELIVRNQTEYPLDNVVVTVQYLRSNGEAF